MDPLCCSFSAIETGEAFFLAWSQAGVFYTLIYTVEIKFKQTMDSYRENSATLPQSVALSVLFNSGTV